MAHRLSAEVRREASEHFGMPPGELTFEQLFPTGVELRKRRIMERLWSEGNDLNRLASCWAELFEFPEAKEGEYTKAAQEVREIMDIGSIIYFPIHEKPLEIVFDKFVAYVKGLDRALKEDELNPHSLEECGRQLWNAYSDYQEQVMRRHDAMMAPANACCICKTVFGELVEMALTLRDLHKKLKAAKWGTKPTLGVIENEALYRH